MLKKNPQNVVPIEKIPKSIQMSKWSNCHIFYYNIQEAIYAAIYSMDSFSLDSNKNGE
jgi:hypothetical protein